MKQSRQENIIYLAVWGLLFAAPILSLYMRTLSDTHAVFDWTEVFIVWRKLVLYLLLFLVHNFLLAPLLVHGHKRVAYFSIVATLLVGFTVYQCNSRPEILPKGPRPPMERAGHLTISPQNLHLTSHRGLSMENTVPPKVSFPLQIILLPSLVSVIY